MRVLITICGRAGSKSVRNKNIRPFLGHPLALYSLAAARLFAQRMNRCETDIVVSSDSKELLSLAEHVPNVLPLARPPALAGARVAKIPAIRHAVESCELTRGRVYDTVIDLDITSPFRTVADIAACFQLSRKKGIDVAFSVVNARRNPYFNMVEVVAGKVRKVKPSRFVTRQEAPPVFEMNASIYAYRREALRRKVVRSPFDGSCGVHVMPETYVLDIDEEADFDVMTLLSGWVQAQHPGIREVFEEVRTLAAWAPRTPAFRSRIPCAPAVTSTHSSRRTAYAASARSP